MGSRREWKVEGSGKWKGVESGREWEDGGGWKVEGSEKWKGVGSGRKCKVKGSGK